MTRSRRSRVRWTLLLIVTLSCSALLSCAGEKWVWPRRDWYPSIAKFFKYIGDSEDASDSKKFEKFIDLFTPAARDEFLGTFGGPEAFRNAVGEQFSVEMPWPGHFRRFALGLGRYLSAVQYDKDGRTAVATTMVSQEAGEYELNHARLYRFNFSYDGDDWKISGFEFVRRDPTISNMQPAYVYSVAAFFVFNAFIIFTWTVDWYRKLFTAYVDILEWILGLRKALLRRIWCPIFTLVMCPLAFFGIVRLFAEFAPRTFNSHVGFLLVLLLVATFMSLAILKEVFDYYHAKAADFALWEMRRDPIAMMLGRARPQFRFDAETYRRVTVFLVLIVMAFGVIGFLPYRKKFRVSVVSQTELVFSVESRVKTAVETTIARLPSFQAQYELASVPAGESYPMIEEVHSQDGVFYRVAFSRRAIGYVPASSVEQIDRTVEFRIEGDYINYLEQLGDVLQLSDPLPEEDPQARILAEAFLHEAMRGIRLADLRGLTRAINDINRSIEFDPVFGDLYMHRAVALAGIGRLLRDDAMHNAFGLSGTAVSNPDKVDVIFYRAHQNLELAERLEVDPALLQAVDTLIEIYRGREVAPVEGLESRHPYALLSQIYTSQDTQSAIEAADALLRIEPDNARALNDRGILRAVDDRTLAEAAFDQVSRVSGGFIEGLTNLATTKLARDRAEGLSELSAIVENEPDFNYRARLVRNFFIINVIAWVVLTLTVIMVLFGTLRLVFKSKMDRVVVRSRWGSFYRLTLLLLLLLFISVRSVVWALPSYGEVGPLVPSLLSVIGR